jgi:50S ribosomal protein L16 3-hydroxylase
MIKTLLGGLSPTQFLRDYWQKKPLLVRQAIPGFCGVLSQPEILRLARDEDIESRLVTQQRGQWSMQRGPLSNATIKLLPKTNWTILIQDLNHHIAAGRDLLREFSFIPHARLDDLMVSYALPGGGVGPHFDSYDVFLLQGSGERCWRISAQTDLALRPNVPLKILKNFKAEQEWTLAPGDMLYLPPNIAHEGTALSECTTYSIGFRAPSAQELAFNFLNFLQDELQLDGMYGDADLRLQSAPGEINETMIRRTGEILKKLSWNSEACAKFLGAYLTEPKPRVFFSPPEKVLSLAQFRRDVAARGISLDLKSRMLTHKRWVFINGERVAMPLDGAPPLRELCNRWMISPKQIIDPSSLTLLHEWYRHGYLALHGKEK